MKAPIQGTDLFKSLETAAGDDERRALLAANMLDQLSPAARGALDILSAPHWIEPSMLGGGKGVLVRKGPLDELRDRGLVRSLAGERLSIASDVRAHVLDRLAQDRRDDYTALSRRFHDAFSPLAGQAAEPYLEAQYHRLAFDEAAAARQMFRDAVDLKSEPVFAFAALRRLLEGWREQADRGVLSEPSVQALKVAELFDPSARRRPAQEVELLAAMTVDGTGHDPAVSAEIALRSGLAWTALGDGRRAEAVLKDARALYRILDDPRGAAECGRALGRLRIKADRYAEARTEYDGAAREFRRLGLPIGEAHCIKARAEVDMLTGELNAAEPAFQHAIARFETQGAKLGEANSRVALANLHITRGDFEPAGDELRAAAPTYDLLETVLGQANCAKGWGWLQTDQGDYGAAEASLLAAMTLYDHWGSATGTANVLLLTGRLRVRQGDAQTALGLLDQADKAYAALEDRLGAATVLRERAVALAHLDRAAEAVGLMDKSVDMFMAIGSRVEAALSALALAELTELAAPDGADEAPSSPAPAVTRDTAVEILAAAGVRAPSLALAGLSAATA